MNILYKIEGTYHNIGNKYYLKDQIILKRFSKKITRYLSCIIATSRI